VLTPGADDHELLRVFEADGLGLNGVLHEMLNEHHAHRTERRGCGYTQASRHLAEHVNLQRHPFELDEVRLFADRDTSRVRALVEGAAAHGLSLSWRNLDRRPMPDSVSGDADLASLYALELERQARLRRLPSRMEREESRLLAQVIVDLLLPVSASSGPFELPPWPERLEIGTCPLAEKYFLELAHGLVRRGGVMNVMVSDTGEPLLVEKLNLGDNHSCFSVTELLLNGVRLPPGSLFGATYEGNVGVRPCHELKGQVIPVSRCSGFRFLRLTTLAVSPENRKRAYTTHFDAQVAGGLFEPGSATVGQIEGVAWRQLGSERRPAEMTR
jgi:hypothetical protein